MAIYKRGEVYWYKFRFAGREIRESAKTKLKTLAKKAEEKRKRELPVLHHKAGHCRGDELSLNQYERVGMRTGIEDEAR